MNSAVFRPTSFLCMTVHVLFFVPLIACASRVLRFVCKRTCQDGGHSRPGVCFGPGTVTPTTLQRLVSILVARRGSHMNSCLVSASRACSTGLIWAASVHKSTPKCSPTSAMAGTRHRFLRHIRVRRQQPSISRANSAFSVTTAHPPNDPTPRSAIKVTDKMLTKAAVTRNYDEMIGLWWKTINECHQYSYFGLMVCG
jgi:hypothetical protein